MDVTGLGAVADLASSVINRIWPDATESDKQKISLALSQLQAQTSLQLSQNEVNKVEAASPSLFIAGWRPALGWCIAFILMYSYIIYPMSLFAIALLNIHASPPKLALDENLWQLILGMLGLSVGRSIEKIKGVR